MTAIKPHHLPTVRLRKLDAAQDPDSTPYVARINAIGPRRTLRTQLLVQQEMTYARS